MYKPCIFNNLVHLTNLVVYFTKFKLVNQVNVKTRLFAHYGPEKEKFSQGVLALKLMKTGDILVGAGDGTVAQVRISNGSSNNAKNKSSYLYKKIKYVFLLDLYLVKTSIPLI